MENHEILVVLLLVLNLLSVGQSVGRSAVVGCALHQHICKPDEDCNLDAVYPFGECQKIIFKRHSGGKTNKRFSQNGEVDVGLSSGDMAKRISSGITSEESLRHKDQDGPYQNDKYDMTYFENYDSVSETPYEHRQTVVRNGLTGRDPVNRNLDRGQRNQYNTGDNRVYVGQDSSHRLKHKRTFQHDEKKDDNLPPIGIPGIPIRFPLKHARHLAMETRDSKFEDKEAIHGKRAAETAEPQKVKQEPENENSLDFDIEIKPLSLSDSKYFVEEKTKLSSIPKKPSAKKEIPQKIEHIQTNIVDTTPTKKTEVGVLIGGKLDQAKTNLVHEKSPDQTYDKVKDFFKSQQVSSLVDAPVAEKKEGVKFYSLSSGEENVNVKRSSVPMPSIYPDGIRLDLKESLNLDKASDLLSALQGLLWGPSSRNAVFTSVDTEDNAVLFHMLNNTTTSGGNPSSVVERINQDKSLKTALNKALGVTILSASLQSKNPEEIKDENNNFMLTTLIVAGCVTGILLASVCIFVILKRTQENSKWVPRQAGHEAASDYQSLWRQLRQATWETPIHTPSVAHADNGEQKGILGNKDLPPKYSWSEEPVDTKMDISTGHVVLSYMEDHLKNENRLSKEWEDLSIYEAEPDRTDVGKDLKNSKKNRYSDVLPFDHNRVKLRETSNATGSDYINASYIIDDDPRNPAYIATQGPLGSTVADFWQMVWEQGVVVIVMLTKLADLGLPQCHRYWPEKGHEVYHIYQVHLISEHIWCSDYLVRSFYLKNVQTGETRTVTQFHYLTWPHLGIPISSKPLLDFRRKVLKCFRSHSCPVVVHCSGGIDRTGTYILIDMVLSKMSKGTKEIDIAATLEHLRDQRPQMVKTKAQFEFALTSVAEEVNAILQVLTKH